MKFRPKKCKSVQLNELLSIEVDEASDDELDETEHHEPNAPLTPPESPERRRKLNNSKDVLRLNLHHGDILIQQGAGLQKYYEVFPLLVGVE